MKVEGWLFLGCGIFFAGTDVVYWYSSKEVTGTTALALAVGLAILTGFYVLFTVAAPGSLIVEIERRLRVSEPVIKFITVRMDEEQKRLAKVKALRDSKVKRSAQPAPVAESVTEAPIPAVETAEATACRRASSIEEA